MCFAFGAEEFIFIIRQRNKYFKKEKKKKKKESRYSTVSKVR